MVRMDVTIVHLRTRMEKRLVKHSISLMHKVSGQIAIDAISHPILSSNTNLLRSPPPYLLFAFAFVPGPFALILLPFGKLACPLAAPAAPLAFSIFFLLSAAVFFSLPSLMAA
jgi:hypothetical protein